MRKGIQYIGYILINDEWAELSDRLNFPAETVGDNPFEYIQELFKTSGIERYLVSYYEFEIKE